MVYEHATTWYMWLAVSLFGIAAIYPILYVVASRITVKKNKEKNNLKIKSMSCSIPEENLPKHINETYDPISISGLFDDEVDECINCPKIKYCEIRRESNE